MFTSILPRHGVGRAARPCCGGRPRTGCVTALLSASRQSSGAATSVSPRTPPLATHRGLRPFPHLPPPVRAAAASADGGAGAAPAPEPGASQEEDGEWEQQQQQQEEEEEEVPWTPEFIRAMVRLQEEDEERTRGEELTGLFDFDPEGLYDYVDRAYEDGPRYVGSPMALLEEQATGEPTVAYPASVANDIVGMGSWRLKDDVDPVIEFLVSRIEGCWREIMDTDLCLYPREKWKSLGWDLADSEDPQRELDGFSFADIPNPDKGEAGYPRLLLENRVYCSKVFRKVHVEVALRQDGLQVLHVCIYPRYNYDLPIFGLDVVMVEGRTTLAIVDCCPLRKDLKLPHHYLETMALLQRTFLAGQDPSARRIPEWGAAIFSPLALCITPSGPEELSSFVKYAVALHRAHLIMAQRAVPLAPRQGDRRAEAKLRELHTGQERFCAKNLVNKKTRRVLEVAFGQEWADAYMSKLMFDFDPSYEPPYFDASYERLYQYFDENPEFGELADEATELEQGAEGDRAVESLESVLSGRPVSQEKLSMAMEFLYQSDPTFRAAVKTLSGDRGEGMPGSQISKELLAVMRPDGRSQAER